MSSLTQVAGYANSTSVAGSAEARWETNGGFQSVNDGFQYFYSEDAAVKPRYEIWKLIHTVTYYKISNQKLKASSY